MTGGVFRPLACSFFGGARGMGPCLGRLLWQPSFSIGGLPNCGGSVDHPGRRVSFRDERLELSEIAHRHRRQALLFLAGI